MKINPDFILKKLNDESVLVATGQASKRFYGIIHLNETSAFLVEKLRTDQTEQSLADALTSAYDVDTETAAADVAAFVKSAKDAGILDE
jgi:hypothetical protein